MAFILTPVQKKREGYLNVKVQNKLTKCRQVGVGREKCKSRREKGQDKQSIKGCDFYASIVEPKSSRKTFMLIFMRNKSKTVF